MSPRRVQPDSLAFRVLGACGDHPLTTAQIFARTKMATRNHPVIYRLRDAGLLTYGQQAQNSQGRPIVTWLRTQAGDEALRLSATRLKALQAHVLICLGEEYQRTASIPCPTHLTRARGGDSWRATRGQVLGSLAGEGLVDWQRRGAARLTKLGVAALPDARARLGLPEPALREQARDEAHS